MNKSNRGAYRFFVSNSRTFAQTWIHLWQTKHYEWMQIFLPFNERGEMNGGNSFFCFGEIGLVLLQNNVK